MREVTKTANSLSDYPSKSVDKLAQAISELSESPELSESACNLVKVNQSILKTILVSVTILKTSMTLMTFAWKAFKSCFHTSKIILLVLEANRF